MKFHTHEDVKKFLENIKLTKEAFGVDEVDAKRIVLDLYENGIKGEDTESKVEPQEDSKPTEAKVDADKYKWELNLDSNTDISVFVDKLWVEAIKQYSKTK